MSFGCWLPSDPGYLMFTKSVVFCRWISPSPGRGVIDAAFHATLGFPVVQGKVSLSFGYLFSGAEHRTPA